MGENIMGVLARADHGEMVERINKKLSELCAAVIETGTKGYITLKINVDKIEGGDVAISVKVDVTAKVPEPSSSADLYFADEYGALSRKDPRQPELPVGVRQFNNNA